MKLGEKITAVSVGAMLTATVVGLIVVTMVIRSSGIRAQRDQLAAVIHQAETVRENFSRLHQTKSFDYKKLLEDAKGASDLRKTELYSTIPVVSAWQGLREVASQEKLDFRVPRFQPRNPENQPTPYESEILRHLEKGNSEYFEVVDGKVVYAKAIYLTKDCLICHGDPATSPTGDGKDMVGYKMEGWQDGQLSGAFVLSAPMSRVYEVVRAGVGQTLLWIVPLTGLIGWGIWRMNDRTITRPLQAAIRHIDGASVQTASASAEISSTSQSLAEGASEQAASLEETSASLEEVSSMIKRNADHAQSAKVLANETLASATHGTADMQDMIKAMAEIKASSDGIAKIIKTIDEIAFQTNILALNAAVEAARAGDAGAGFAVVADEVRNLAQRSAVAARETADKIEDSIQKSQNGVKISDLVAVSLSEIAERAQKVDAIVAEIATASTEQAHGIDQINIAVGHMDKAVQSTAANSEEAASASSELSSQANALKGAVNELVDLLEGRVGQGSGSGHLLQAGQRDR